MIQIQKNLKSNKIYLNNYSVTLRFRRNSTWSYSKNCGKRMLSWCHIEAKTPLDSIPSMKLPRLWGLSRTKWVWLVPSTRTRRLWEIWEFQMQIIGKWGNNNPENMLSLKKANRNSGRWCPSLDGVSTMARLTNYPWSKREPWLMSKRL